MNEWMLRLEKGESNVPDRIFDFESAKRVFNRYISAYDLTDDKIRL